MLHRESRSTGGQPTVILSDTRLCYGDFKFLWFPGGRFIYTRWEAGQNQWTSNLWEIQVDPRSGEPASEPQRITNWAEVNVYGLSGTRDGKQLAVTRESNQADVYVGGLEREGRGLKNLRRLTLDEANDLPGQWMPDSKAVVFISDRNNTQGIYKQRLDQTVAEAVVTGPDYKDWPVVSPDGSWILYLSRASPESSAATPVRIMRVPTSGGPPQLVLEGRSINYLACARSPAALCVFGQWTPDQGQVIFSALDPVKGKGPELTRVTLRKLAQTYYHSLDVSHDGSRLAFTQFDPSGGHIEILPLGRGEPREIKVKGRPWRLSWAPDGKGLFVGTANSLLFVDLEGRTTVLWHEARPDNSGWDIWGVPSPDGRYLALVSYAGESNVWLLEDY